MSKRVSKKIRRGLKDAGITPAMPGYRDVYQGLKRGVNSQNFRVRRVEQFRASLAIKHKAANEQDSVT